MVHVHGHKSLHMGSEQSREDWQDMDVEDAQWGQGHQAGMPLCRGSVPKGTGLLSLSPSSDLSLSPLRFQDSMNVITDSNI